jgi:hypothetical protein
LSIFNEAINLPGEHRTAANARKDWIVRRLTRSLTLLDAPETGARQRHRPEMMSCMPLPPCQHATVAVLNPWEMLRKYVCADCNAVMTCACCTDIATFVLPHQASRGVDPRTRDNVPVTAAFVPAVAGTAAA